MSTRSKRVAYCQNQSRSLNILRMSSFANCRLIPIPCVKMLESKHIIIRSHEFLYENPAPADFFLPKLPFAVTLIAQQADLKKSVQQSQQILHKAKVLNPQQLSKIFTNNSMSLVTHIILPSSLFKRKYRRPGRTVT